MYNYSYYNNGERFIVPFLVGSLAGGAAVSLTRPRPVFVSQPMYQPIPQPIYPIYYPQFR